MASPETRRQLLVAAQACEDKKGEDTRILELDPADSGLADFFLITSASNDRQVVAIADEIEFRLKQEFGLYAHSVEGRQQGEWILLDYVDIVIHVFLAEKRAFYDIERLRKSAQTKTPPEIEHEVAAELKAALTSKTLAARKKATPKKAAKKLSPAKKAAPKKTIAKGETKVTPTKKAAAKKAPAKKVTAKAPAKKTAAKAAPKKAAVTTKKPVAAKAPAKKAPAKKAAPKKAALKKVSAAAAPAPAAAPLTQGVVKFGAKPPVIK